MTGLDFFVDLTVNGTVLGLDHTSTPEAVLGVFGAQVHRLGWLTRDDEVEPVLVERYGTFPQRVDVDAGLRLAVHRAAVARRVYPADEAAVTEVGLLLDAGLEPDAAVRAWLSTVTGVPDDTAGLRRLRDQIHEVEPALPRLTDPQLAAELRRWSTEKPRLLAG